MQIELYPRVVADSEVFSGKPIIAGTHALVSTLIHEVASGKALEDVAREHGVSADDVRAALEYAAKRTDESASLPGTPPAGASTIQSFAEQLEALRAQIVASGEPLLDWDEVSTEVAERRGERYMDAEG